MAEDASTTIVEEKPTTGAADTASERSSASTTTVTDKAPADTTSKDTPADKAPVDKAPADKGAKSASKSAATDLFSDADEDDDAAPADKKPDATKPDEKPDDKVETGLAPDAKWREKLIDRATKDLADTLPAAKLAARKDAIMNTLKRYKSQAEFMLAGIAAQEKIRSGEYKVAKLPDDATDEQKAAFRKEQGIPEKPEAYDIPKVAGHEWTDADKPVLEEYKQVAFKLNANQEQMNGFIDWYAKDQQKKYAEAVEQTAAMDREDKELASDKLRAEFGIAEFKPRIRVVDRLLNDTEAMPNGLGKKLMSARFLDDNGKWRRLINDVDYLRHLSDQAGDRYGEGAMITGDARANMNNRKAEIEGIMKTDISRYYKEGLDKELLDINSREEAARGRRGR